MNAISLFSGAGGFEIGFDRAGIDTVLQAESDPWCRSVLERHWPDVKRVDDVREVDATTLRRRCRDVVSVGANSDAEWLGGTPRSLPSIDLVYGGFPCQDVSVAGKRAGLSGERSGLWSEFARVLSELRPRWAVIENVPGLLSSDNGRDFLRILVDLDGLGYGVAWRVLDGRHFGVPQRRRRVFLVGCLGDAQRAAQVLAVCESCGGHPAPRGEAGQDVAFTLAGGSPDTSRRISTAWNTTYLAATLSASGGPSGTAGRHHEDDDNLVIARGQPSRNERIDAETETLLVASPVRASDGHHGHSSGRGDGADNLVVADVADPISAHEGKTYTHEGKNNFRTHNVIAFDDRNQAASEDEHHTLRGAGLQRSDVVAFDWQASSGNDESWRGKGRQHVVRSGDYAGANSATRVDAVSYAAGVRRLTPLECERLMGWPDEHTRYTADGREIPDSHRYRLCGNGVIATVAEWIGHRLIEVDRQLFLQEA